MPTDGESQDRRIAVLHETAKALTSRLDFQGILRLTVERICSLWGPRYCSLLVTLDRTMELEFQVAVGATLDLIGRRTRPEGSAVARAILDHEVIVDSLPGARSELLRQARVPGLAPQSCVVAVPLMSRGEIIGVLELVDPEGPLAAVDLKILGAIGDYSAIAIDNARNYEQVCELTIRDDLTTLYNARHLRTTLSAELTRAARFQRPLSVVFLDLDFFKSVNDTKGHLVGSSLLSEFGAFVARHIRKIDMGFRYGGDEFAVLLIETPHEGALVMANRFRELLRQQRFLTRHGLSVQLTASIGVATYPEDGTTTTDVLAAADRAMYRAKELGRDEVISTRDLA